LQYLAGMACRQLQLWGKAQQLLGSAVHRLQEPALQRRAWCTLAEMAEMRQDITSANNAYKAAARI
jgi:HemY protein